MQLEADCAKQVEAAYMSEALRIIFVVWAALFLLVAYFAFIERAVSAQADTGVHRDLHELRIVLSWPGVETGANSDL